MAGAARGTDLPGRARPAGRGDRPGGAPPLTAEADPPATYAERRDRFADRRRRAAVRARRLAAARTVAFAAAVVLGVAAEWTSDGRALVLGGAAAASLLLFGWLVVRHRRVRRRERHAGALAEVSAEALARQRRAWDELPPPGPAAGPPPDDHPYAADLDLLGAASLRTLLDTVATAPGAARLRRWLLEAARPSGGPMPAATRRRQRLVEALTPRLDLRDELAVHGRLGRRADPAAVDRFLSWAESSPWLPSRPLVHAAAWLLPVATWGLAGAHLAGLVGGPWWLLPVLTTLYLAGRTSEAVHRRFEDAGAGEAALGRWAEALDLIAGLGGDPELGTLAEPLVGADEDAPERLRRLERLVHLADARHGLMHFFLQVLFCWDVHVLRGLERWQRRSGSSVRGWIDGLARADALAALAALRHAHPDWSMPELRTPASTVEAEQLGHPLIPPDDCVRNDVEVGPSGTFLFVTGSNMSGKSTLLRALGVNTVLARAGGPVCARRLTLPPIAVHTSLQVEDSVVRGVSQYLAEVHRVRDVVASARELAPADGSDAPQEEDRSSTPRLLYLLDEPLQGTNEAERREAVRIILRELIGRGAVGALATHDLRLHEASDLRAAARPVHFRGRLRPGDEEPSLTFDYRLREGPATSTNALDLLRIAGLGPSDRDGEPPSA